MAPTKAYQRLCPDIWSECLSYLPPNELSSASYFFVPNPSAENAAWLSVLFMVKTAQRYSSILTQHNAFSIPLFCSHPERPTRFRDETWQNLYGFLFRVLSEVHGFRSAANEADDHLEPQANEDDNNERNHEHTEIHNAKAIFLLVGIVFGKVAFRPLDLAQRKLLDSISSACARIASDREAPYAPSQTRCYFLSKRLADEGFWNDAATILLKQQQKQQLSIDGMICVSTFLIDRLYSQTYVKQGEDDEELETAVRLGRMAVQQAQEQCESQHQGSTQKPTAISTTIKIAPPPPMESLFENEKDRCIHAKLALGKALSLLAQHVGLGATDPENLEVTPEEACDLENFQPIADATPDMMQEKQLLWNHDVGWIRRRMAWQRAFFEESHRQFDEGLALLGENCSARGLLESAQAESMYCAASVASVFRWTHTTQHFAVSAVHSFSSAFSKMMRELLRTMTNLSLASRNAILDGLVRCGKDYGKTCRFCETLGVNYRHEELLDPEMVFAFVHLVSVHRYGLVHPTTQNIEELSKQQRENGSLAETYDRVKNWLVANYGKSILQ